MESQTPTNLNPSPVDKQDQHPKLSSHKQT